MDAPRLLLLSLLVTGCAVTAPPAPPQPAAAPADGRAPAPYAIEHPPAYAFALREGTRTASGAPGPNYWQNFASYTITARVDASGRRLLGGVEIAYRNNSPDTLRTLHLELAQNLHAPGAVRFEEAEVTGGMEVGRVSVDRQVLTTAGEGAQPRYAIAGTRLVILPPRAVPPGGTVNIGVDFGFRIPQAGAGARMGYSGETLLYLAYWYPQMAVYDDIVGWHPDPFVGTSEFYAGFANYDVRIDAPAGWLLTATGALQNEQEVLRPAILERLRRAEQSDETVAVVTPADFPNNVTTAGSNGRLTWRFRADSVRDVAFSLTRNVHWDARRTSVGDRNADGVADYTRIDAVYRPDAPRWRQAARYAAHAITFLSGFTGIPYPWPHMSAIEGEGIIGGGMEYPMMTLISGYNQATDADLYNVVAHELAHMWVPMIVSTDERRYSWLDEGTTTFNENAARADFFPGRKHWLGEHEQYLQIAGSGEEGEMMRRSAYHYSGGAFGIASYSKPASALVALRGVLGEDVFLRAYRTFLDRWKYRHPYPWDLWSTFEDVSGRDLDWFWHSWYFTTWTLDQAITNVTVEDGRARITVENRGRMPMPTSLRITLANGSTIEQAIAVEHWLAGHREATVTVAVPAAVARVELDPGQYYPDADARNNVWRK